MTDKQVLTVPQKEYRDWSLSVVRTCDRCGHYKPTLPRGHGISMCPTCFDLDYASKLKYMLELAIEQLEAAGKCMTDQEVRCVALTAENAALKHAAQELKDEMEAHHDTDGLFSYDADGEQMDALIRLCDAQGSIDESLLSIKTPATETFLAEVRAQGVESAGEYLKQYAQGLHEEARLVLQDAGELCNGFAAQLRQEAK